MRIQTYCGHPAEEVVTGREGTSYCAVCVRERGSHLGPPAKHPGGIVDSALLLGGGSEQPPLKVFAGFKAFGKDTREGMGTILHELVDEALRRTKEGQSVYAVLAGMCVDAALEHRAK